ncbi:hypothetical protein LshimejAT787_0900260 [Lyophyllum shimeji]|uniref:F-box domain-containing protein n=1 Tax=Lyophyllum shimeji TaxID=47721 RepID=A0A9P3US42_LYOSH|nr:hypothetical protein LshimejAT787_0900260 [Lyophyllum shimeji]
MTLCLSLPFDILESIIEQIDDYHSLLQCTTVSHAFLYFGRKRLFRTIHLGADDAGLSCTRLLIILVDRPELLHHVRALHVDSPDEVLGKAFAPLLRHIAEGNHLRKFVMNMYGNLSWGELGPALQDSFRSLFKSTSLRTLCFQGQIPVDFPIELLATSPALTHLSISHYHSNNRYDASDAAIHAMLPSPSTESTASRPSLESLEIMGQFATRLVKYLAHPLSPIQLSQLRELRLMKLYDDVDASTAWEVIKAAASSLERLVWYDCSPYRPVLLESMQRLRFVELHGYTLLPRCKWLASLFMSERMPKSIESITLTFSAAWVGSRRMKVGEVDEVFMSKEHQLDGTLSALCDGRAFPCFRAIALRVLFERSVEIDPRERGRMKGRWFPELQSTGFLSGEILTTE